MNREKLKKDFLTLSWIFSIFSLFMAFLSIKFSLVATFFLLIGGLMIFPPAVKILTKKYSFLKNWVRVLIFIIFIFVALILFINAGVEYALEHPLESSAPSKLQLNEFGENYKIDSMSACYMAQQFVEGQLKAPSTAKFQNCYDARINYQRNQTYFIHSYVDSQNSFGAMLRTDYSVKIKDNQDETWKLVDLEIYE